MEPKLTQAGLELRVIKFRGNELTIELTRTQQVTSS